MMTDSHRTCRKSTMSSTTVECVVMRTLKRGVDTPLVAPVKAPTKDHSCCCTVARHVAEPPYSTTFTSGAIRLNSRDQCSSSLSATMMRDGPCSSYWRFRSAIKLAATSACLQSGELSTKHTPSFSNHVAKSQRATHCTPLLGLLLSSTFAKLGGTLYGRLRLSWSNWV